MRSATTAAARCGRSSTPCGRRASCSTERERDAESSQTTRLAAIPSLDVASRDVVRCSPMTDAERLVADYAGTGLTIGPHPMALRRDELAMRGVLRASDLPRGAAGPPRARGRHGDHAAAPGHGQGVRVPHARGRDRHRQHHRPAGSLHASRRASSSRSRSCSSKAMLQNQDGVTSVKAERVIGLSGGRP